MVCGDPGAGLCEFFWDAGFCEGVANVFAGYFPGIDGGAGR